MCETKGGHVPNFKFRLWTVTVENSTDSQPFDIRTSSPSTIETDQ